eukprot:gene50395-67497_t
MYESWIKPLVQHERRTDVFKDGAPEKGSFIQKEAEVECTPTFEQVSQEAIIEEANINIAILNALENILHDRATALNSYQTILSKSTLQFEVCQLSRGSARNALDALFVYEEQDLQQAKLHGVISDIRKSVAEAKANASRQLADYERELTNAKKDVSVAEKKVAKSKEHLVK